MKYRIIEEVDGNDRRHFEVQFWKKGLFGWKWVTAESYRMEFVSTRNFPTHAEAMEYIRCFKKTRAIVTEGDTND